MNSEKIAKSRHSRVDLKIQIPSFFSRGVGVFGGGDNSPETYSGAMEDGSIPGNLSKELGDVDCVDTSLFGMKSRSNSIDSRSSRSGSSSFNRYDSGTVDTTSSIFGLRSREASGTISPPRTGSSSFGQPESPRPGSSRAFNAISNFFHEITESVTVRVAVN